MGIDSTMASPAPAPTLSATEAKLYDRQLRLWGISAQAALMQSKVAVVQLTAMHVECLKNTILAGVGQVTIIDPDPVTAYDLGFNYFLREEDIGKPKGPAAAARLQQLNPHVKVVCENELKEDGHAVVIVPMSYKNYSVSTLVELDHKCRKNSAAFFVTQGAGHDAWFFAQGGEYTVKDFTPKPGDNDPKPMDPVDVKFPSFEECVQADLSKCQLRMRPGAGTCMKFMLLLKFRASQPPTNNTTDDQVKFAKFAADLVKTLPAKNQAELSDEALQTFFCLSLHEPLVITASCVSGTMSQEVMKAITKKDVPWNNTVTFTRSMMQEIMVPYVEAPKKPSAAPVVDEQGDLTMGVEPVQEGEEIELL